MKKNLLIILYMLLISIILWACKKNVPLVADRDMDYTPTATTVRPSLEPTVTILPGNQQNTDSLANTMTAKEYPIVDGSTATIPLSEAVYQLVTGATKEEADLAIVHTKTSNSYKRLIQKEVDLLIVYEPSEEVLQTMKESGVKIIMKPIGKDALIFMENSSNQVSSLRKDQIIDIYSGKITNWSQVGGDNEEILAFQRPDNSGSQTLMQKLVMGNKKMMTGPNVITYESMEGILKAMADYNGEGNTLGYSVYYYAKNMYQVPDLKFMKVDGIEPSLDSIYDNSYPYINQFYAVIREDEPESSNAHRIFDWITGEEGQSLVKDLGYVPIKMKAAQDENTIRETIQDTVPNGFQYLAASYSMHNELYMGDVTFYKDNWEVAKTIQNAYVVGDIGLVSKNALIPMGYAVYNKDGTFVMKYGIYSVSKEDFVLPAVYDSIRVLDEEKGYYIVSDSSGNKVIDQSGNIYATGFMQGEGFGASKRGDYYWIHDYSLEEEKERYAIYDSNFSQVKEFYKDYDEALLYEADGTVYFSKEKFLEHFGYSFDSDVTFYLFNNYDDSDLISVGFNGMDMVLDKSLNIVAQKPLETPYNSSYTIYGNIYSDSDFDSNQNRANGNFYDENGSVIRDEKGNSYNNIISENYYGYTGNGYKEKKMQILYKFDKGKLDVYHLNEKKHIEIALADFNNISYIYLYKDIVIVCNNDENNKKTRIYKNHSLITEEKGWYCEGYASGEERLEGLILTDYGTNMDQNKYVIINQDGELLYHSVIEEKILGIDGKYIQLIRGNYMEVIDYNGEVIVKRFKNGLDD